MDLNTGFSKTPSPKGRRKHSLKAEANYLQKGAEREAEASYVDTHLNTASISAM